MLHYQQWNAFRCSCICEPSRLASVSGPFPKLQHTAWCCVHERNMTLCATLPYQSDMHNIFTLLGTAASTHSEETLCLSPLMSSLQSLQQLPYSCQRRVGAQSPAAQGMVICCEANQAFWCRSVDLNTNTPTQPGTLQEYPCWVAHSCTQDLSQTVVWGRKSALQSLICLSEDHANMCKEALYTWG